MWYHSPLQSYAFLDTVPATYTHTHNYFNNFHVPWRGLSADYRKLHFAHEPTAYTGSKLRGLITEKYPMTEEGSLSYIFKLTLIPQVWASEIKHGPSFPWFLHRAFVCVQPNSWRFEKMEEKHQNVINNLIWIFFIFILSNISLELGSSLLLSCLTLSHSALYELFPSSSSSVFYTRILISFLPREVSWSPLCFLNSHI